jgi:hypothetical protein
MRTRDFETPEENARIDLVIGIVKAQRHANSMSTSLQLIRDYDKERDERFDKEI